MKKKLRARIILILSVLLAAGAAAAWAADGEGTSGRNGSIRLKYNEKADGSEAVEGAEFACIKVADLTLAADEEALQTLITSLAKDMSGELIPITMDSDAEDLSIRLANSDSLEVHEIRTDSTGEAVATGLSDGVYLIRETKAAEDHLPSSPFLCCIPYTAAGMNVGLTYEVTAEPKPQACGKLVISKSLVGNNTESDREFHFALTFSKEGSYLLTGPDGTVKTWKTGDAVVLRGGESAVISMIPVGVKYEVVETEANADGYTTTSTGTTGTIRRVSEAKATFINKRYQETRADGNTNGNTNGTTNGTGSGMSSTGTSIGGVKTGDTSSLVLFAGLFFASVSAMLGLIFGRKKVSG